MNQLPLFERVILPMANVAKPWYEPSYGGREPYNNHPAFCIDFNLESLGNTDLGEPVVASFDGLVIDARDLGGDWGPVIRILGVSSAGLVYVWHGAHFDRIDVQAGQLVTMGQQIGTIGTAHGKYAAHLHIQIACNRVPPILPIGQAALGYISPKEFYTGWGANGVSLDEWNRVTLLDKR